MSSSTRKPWRASQAVKTRARELRRPLTPAERVLWQRLRNDQLDGAHFRRQHPAGSVVVDFVCVRARLVVEVDGDSRAGQAAYHAERTAWLHTSITA